jgi:hypothetical protein
MVTTTCIFHHFQGAVDMDLTIDLLCKIMNDEDIGDALSRYVTVNSLVLKTYGMKCLDFKYATYIKKMQITDWMSTQGVGGNKYLNGSFPM